MPLLFAATLFVSAFLLFLIQPMIAQMILPRLGGTPAVWNTCMVFFQAALLAGYGYTHSATSYLPTRRQTIIQVCLLALPFVFFLLPFGIGDWKPTTDSNPIWSVLTILLLVVGLPFFVVATSAPLLQRWFASTGHAMAKDPYFLYGASNLGSMLSLLSYPFFFQRYFDLDEQALIWTGGYAAMIVLVAACCVVVWKAAPTVEMPRLGDDAPPITAPPVSAAEAEQHVSKQPVRRYRGRVAVAAPKALAEVRISTALTTELPRQQIAFIAAGVVPICFVLYLVMDWLITYYLKQRTPTWLWLLPTNIGLVMLLILARLWWGETSQGTDDVSWLRRTRWVALAAVPSSLMLGVTTYMTTDIAAVPLFWIVPLALYLLSFILVFARWPVPWTGTPHTYLLYAQPLILLSVGAAIFANWGLPTWGLMFAHLALFFTCVMVCHGELAKDRPAARHLTDFYLMMSIGGVLGGIFNSLLAPFIFQSGITEYGIAVAAAVFLRPQTHFLAWWRKKPMPADDHTFQEYLLDIGYACCLGLLAFALLRISMSKAFWPDSHGFVEFLYNKYKGIFGDSKTAVTFARWTELLAIEGVPVAICLFFIDRPVRLGLSVACLLAANSLLLQYEPDIIYTHRSFFGVQRVRREKNEDNGQTYNVLIHGGIDHGRQNLDPDKRDNPISYFYPTNPIGQVFTAMQSMGNRPPYGVIGLGIGTLASYGQPGQTVRFYEIDPAVLLLSEPKDDSTPYFWYLRDAKKRGVDLDVILGDGRLRMEEAPANHFQVITVDAFSSDAIPVHLLTVEAIQMYLSKLRPDGIIIFNVTNRYVDLPPVLADAARELDLVCLQQGDNYDKSIPDKFGSDWVILYRQQDYRPLAGQMAGFVGAMQPSAAPGLPGLACAMIPLQAYHLDLPSRLDLSKWKAPEPTGRPAWRDRYQDLIRAISWTR